MSRRDYWKLVSTSTPCPPKEGYYFILPLNSFFLSLLGSCVYWCPCQGKSYEGQAAPDPASPAPTLAHTSQFPVCPRESWSTQEPSFLILEWPTSATHLKVFLPFPFSLGFFLRFNLLFSLPFPRRYSRAVFIQCSQCVTTWAKAQLHRSTHRAWASKCQGFIVKMPHQADDKTQPKITFPTNSTGKI